MSKNHLPEKLQRKIVKEGVLLKQNNLRFTVTHVNRKGKLLGRDWYQGFIAVTDKRLVLVVEGVKFLNLKCGDERFTAAKFIEDNVACLEIKFSKEVDPKRTVVFHIYTDKVNRIIKYIDALKGI